MSYTSIFKSECLKAKELIERKLERPINGLEFRSVTRLSNMTFMEMMLMDITAAQSPAEAEHALTNLKRNAEDRFRLSTEELAAKISEAFGVEMKESLKRPLLQKGNGLDLHQIEEDVNEHKGVLPNFIRKKRVKKTLDGWEDMLKKR